MASASACAMLVVVVMDAASCSTSFTRNAGVMVRLIETGDDAPLALQPFLTVRHA